MISSKQAVALYNYVRATFLDMQLVRFLIVGSCSFATNMTVLYFMHGVIGTPLIVADIIAAETSVLVGFTLHHHWTYKKYGSTPLLYRFLRFNLSTATGILISISVQLLIVHLLGINYLIGTIGGSFVALFWNYFANKHFIWAQIIED